MVIAERSTDISLMAHLMRRAGFGAPREELERRSEIGYEATVDELLSPRQANYMPEDIIHRYHVDVLESRFLDSAGANWMYRLVSTDNPMEEKIALFWHGIFATGYSKLNQARSVLNQIDMFRRLGQGRFDDLLSELARDPAMIIWLDNQDNHNGSINENWGRELLELFSMGIGNYSEYDIKEASRAFTGWTLGNAEYMAMRSQKDSIWPYSRISWHFGFRDWDHDDGEKTFLGETGNFNGDDIVRIICEQPATAQFIARHICDFFVADEAPVPQWPYTAPRHPEAVEYLADVYFESDHNVGEMLRACFNSDFFKDAQFDRVKSPAELVVSTLRQSGAITRPSDTAMEAAKVAGFMGQALLAPPSVEGWHEGVEWINSGSIVERVNFASKHMSNVENPGVQAIIDRLSSMNGGHFSPEELVDACLDIVGPLEVEDTTRDSLAEAVGREGDISLRDRTPGDDTDVRVGQLLGLIAATREYQLT